MNQWNIIRRRRGFVVQGPGPAGERVASFPTIDRWYWWLFAPYLIVSGWKAIRDYRD